MTVFICVFVRPIFGRLFFSYQMGIHDDEYG